MSRRTRSVRMRGAAEKYLRHGWRPIPIVPRAKRPLTSWEEFQNRPPTRDEVVTWFTENPDANIGIITGSGSGIIAIDIDGQEGEESLMKLGAQVETLTSRTARGQHLIFTHPGVHVPSRAKVLPGIDVRGDGGYIVAPPSVHQSGFQYRWENRGQAVQRLPAHLLKLVTSVPASSQNLKQLAEGTAAIPEGQRDDTLTRIAGHLLGRGMSLEDALSECLRINETRCIPPLPKDQIENMVARIASRDGSRRSPTTTTTIAPVTKPTSSFVSVCLADVQPEPVRWLWREYVPSGKLTVIEGDPGLGKSSLTLDLAARVSTGRAMPDGSKGGAGSIVVMTCEDGVADTVVPRLQAMQADLRRIHHIESTIDGAGGIRLPSLPEDVDCLRATIEETKAVLVVVDPLMGYLSSTVNSWSDQDVRRALAPLQSLAEEMDVAIVVIRHLNKNDQRKAINRGSGSVAIGGAARAVFVVAKDPENDDRRVIASVKCNVGAPRSMSFHLDGAAGAVRIVWEGHCDYSSDDLVGVTKDRATKLEEAKHLLEHLLANGPRRVKDVELEARARNISSRTLDRARSEQGVLPGKVGGVRVIQLPQKSEKTELAALLSEQRHRQPVEGDEASTSPPPSDTPRRDANPNRPEPGSRESWDIAFDDEDAA